MSKELNAFYKYQELVSQGMPFDQALQQSGLSNLALQRQKDEAGQAQKAGYGQLGGQLIGAFGTKAVTDVMKGEKALGGLREGISNLFGSSGGSNLAQTAAENASWNAAADAATTGGASITTPPVEGGMFAPGSSLGNALGGAGVALGSYGAYKGIKEKNPLAAGLGGLGIAGGLNTLGLALGPLAFAGVAGVPAAAALINKMGDKDRWKEEYSRKKKLVEEGIIPESMLGEAPTAGRSKEQLVALEEQKIAQGQYGNPEFAKTRDVSALKPQDIWGFSVAPETLGKDYMAASEQQRLAYNQKLLEEGLVKEAKGQISYTDPKRAKEIWAQVTGTQSK